MRRTRTKGLKRFHNGKDRYPGRPLGKKTTKSDSKSESKRITYVNKPCCESQEAIDQKNIAMLEELKNVRMDRIWNEFDSAWIAKLPLWFSRKHKKHMGHFSHFLEQRK